MERYITILLLVVSLKVLSQTPTCTLPETVKSLTYIILKNLDRIVQHNSHIIRILK